jgi:hypothetical protein
MSRRSVSFLRSSKRKIDLRLAASRGNKDSGSIGHIRGMRGWTKMKPQLV